MNVCVAFLHVTSNLSNCIIVKTVDRTSMLHRTLAVPVYRTNGRCFARSPCIMYDCKLEFRVVAVVLCSIGRSETLVPHSPAIITEIIEVETCDVFEFIKSILEIKAASLQSN